MSYFRAREEQETRDFLYRVYMTETLRLRNEGKGLTASWLDLIGFEAKPKDTRTAEELAVDVFQRCGLTLGGGEPDERI